MPSAFGNEPWVTLSRTRPEAEDWGAQGGSWRVGGGVCEEMDEQGKTTFLEVWWEPREEMESGQQEAGKSFWVLLNFEDVMVNCVNLTRPQGTQTFGQHFSKYVL